VRQDRLNAYTSVIRSAILTQSRMNTPLLLVRLPAIGALGLATITCAAAPGPSPASVPSTTVNGPVAPVPKGLPTGATVGSDIAPPNASGASTDLSAWCEKYSCAVGADSAIAAALSALAAQGGGTLFVPPGSYCVWRPIVVSTDRIMLKGSGRSTILRPCTPAEGGARERSGPPRFVVQFSASNGGVSDLMLRCDGLPGTTTSALGLVPLASDPWNIEGNRFSGLRIEACNGNGIELQATKRLTVFNSFYDIFITYTGTAIRFDSSAGGSVNSNQFFAITVNNFVTTGFDIQGGRENTFFGCSLETVFGRSINIARGAEDNRFFGTTFDNGPSNGAESVDIVNDEPTSQFYASNTQPSRVSSKIGGTFIGLGAGDTQVGGYSYSSTDGVAKLNTVNGVRIQTNTSLDEGKTLTIGGGINGSLAVGPIVANERLMMPTLASFHAPAANWGPAATFMADGAGRGAIVLSSGFSASNRLGNSLLLSPIGLAATQSGLSSPAPVVIGGGSNIYTSWPGSGLVAKSPDGSKCAVIGIDNAGKLAARPVACP
jgi:hypothetical protein